MDTRVTILITSALLSACASQSPSFAPVIATGSGFYGTQNPLDPLPPVVYGDDTAAPVGEVVLNESAPQAALTAPVSLEAEKQKLPEPIMVARSPFTAATVAPAIYPVTRSSNISIDNKNSAGNPSSYMLDGKKYKVLPFSSGYKKRGIASWYGIDFHGKKTSNGEIYNMHGMTAAHKTLPIPSYVKVTNLKNGRSVILRINDRGPYYADRIIDLSYAAAHQLGVHKPGTEKVEVEAINSAGTNQVYLQLGVFDNPNNARKLQQKVASNYLPQPKIKQVMHQDRVVYKVQIGPLYNNNQVESLNLKLARIGIKKTRYVTVR